MVPEAVFLAGAAAFFATGFLAGAADFAAGLVAVAAFLTGAFLAAAVVVVAFFAAGLAAVLVAGLAAVFAAGLVAVLVAAGLVAVGFLAAGATFSLPAAAFWLNQHKSIQRQKDTYDLGWDLDSSTETLGETEVTLLTTSLDGVVEVVAVGSRRHVELILLGEEPGMSETCTNWDSS